MRRQIPDVVFGALLAFLLVLFGYAVGSSQTPIQQAQQQQTTQPTKGVSSPKSADDRIADYTEVLMWLTGVLAVSTVGLWIWTHLGLRQSRKTTEQQLRAFVFAKGFTGGPNLIPNTNQAFEYIFVANVQNVGLTPATDARSWIETITLQGTGNEAPVFAPEGRGPSTVFGPQSGGARSGYKTIPIDQMQALWRKETEIFIWSRIEYRDVFNPGILHHHEQCARIFLIHDPATAPPPNHMPYVQFSVVGPQNTTG
jgi:hypothetical protein